MNDILFSKLNLGGLELKNRLVMAPLFLSYAAHGGKPGTLMRDHYQLMARSGVAMIVVESAAIEYPAGSGSDFVLRADTDEYLDGLTMLAATIKKQGALACLQINHVGRFLPQGTGQVQAVAPSAVPAMGPAPRPLAGPEIKEMVHKYAAAALRAKKAGFDAVELHGGTGYLLAQFVSPRTNVREDEYGGTLENRMRFGIEVLSAVKAAVGAMPVGFRFLADEWLPGGLGLEESIPYAKALAKENVAYLSVMGGTYESFFLPDVIEKSRKDGFMADLAGAIKKEVDVPVIAAGRISNGKLARQIINGKQADLIGLARVLWTDPQWPEKVRQDRENEIIHCDPACGDTCMQMIMMGKPAFCVRWPTEKQREWKGKKAER
jgi:NADPH2 dehydrogenase